MNIVHPARILIAVLLLVTISGSQAGAHAKTALFFYGSWRIVRVEEVGGHAYESLELANKQIGREIEFRPAAMVYKKDTLYFERACAGLRYKINRRKLGRYDIDEKGTLAYYNLPSARPGWIQRLIVRCRGGVEYEFELAHGKQLAIYYDGWFFFLEKSKA